MSTIASHSPLNISETVRDIGLVPRSKGPSMGNGFWRVEWSRDRRRHVTLKGQTRDPTTLGAQSRKQLQTISSNCLITRYKSAVLKFPIRYVR